MCDYGQTYIQQSGAFLLRPEPAKWRTFAPAFGAVLERVGPDRIRDSHGVQSVIPCL